MKRRGRATAKKHRSKSLSEALLGFAGVAEGLSADTQIFTFVAEYAGGTYISQCAGLNPGTALKKWLETYDFSVIKHLPSRSLQVLRDDLSERNPIPLDSVRNVWCVTSAPPKGLFLLNMIKTDV